MAPLAGPSLQTLWLRRALAFTRAARFDGSVVASLGILRRRSLLRRRLPNRFKRDFAASGPDNVERAEDAVHRSLLTIAEY
jgi:hypothetical protein